MTATLDSDDLKELLEVARDGYARIIKKLDEINNELREPKQILTITE